MAGTGSGDSLRNDFALFVDAPLKPLLILVIDIHVLAITEPACAFLPLLLVFARWARRTVGINRKSWFSYHSQISVGFWKSFMNSVLL